VASNRVRFLLAQVGPKRGSRAALARLLSVGELPGAGWKAMDHRTWRTGVGGRSGWQVNARAVGSITAWRSFEQTTAGRHLWVQVTQLASPADAAEALAALEDKSLANLRFQGRGRRAADSMCATPGGPGHGSGAGRQHNSRTVDDLDDLGG
jgi:hypothetical protein